MAQVLPATPDLLIELGKIGLWIQAVGLIVIIWIILQAITLYFNRKRRRTLYKISDDLKRLERKIDKLDKKIGK